MNKKKLKKLLVEYHVPIQILNHMVKVTALALFLGEKIKRSGRTIDLNLIRWTGLLHDLLKVCDFRSLDPSGFKQKVMESDLRAWRSIIKKYQKLGHAQACAQLMLRIGEEKISAIIIKHHLGSIIDPDPTARPTTLEEKIIYYADKRVMHDQIVTLRNRLDDLSKRYSKGPDQRILQIYATLEELEKEILKTANIKPQEIIDAKISNSHSFESVVSYLS